MNDSFASVMHGFRILVYSVRTVYTDLYDINRYFY